MPSEKPIRWAIMPPAYDYKRIDQACHIPVKCTDPDCMGCMFCAGGLYACEVCGGGEGSMTTQCPGRPLSADELDAVYAQRKDFNQNRWWTADPIEEN